MSIDVRVADYDGFFYMWYAEGKGYLGIEEQREVLGHNSISSDART